MIFVNGCFWHGHTGCRYFVWPKNNEDFWKEKINSNIDRDKQIVKRLADLGWNVIVIWECELKRQVRDDRLSALVNEIKCRE